MSVPVIHVVDDDEPMRAAVARLLRATGYEVRTYASAGDFLLAPPEPVPGRLLRSPDARPQRARAAAGPERRPCRFVVFLTGRGDVSSSVRAMKAGAVDFYQAGGAGRSSEGSRSGAERDRSSLRSVRHPRRSSAHASLTARAVGSRPRSRRKAQQAIACALGITERTVKMHRGGDGEDAGRLRRGAGALRPSSLG